MFTDIKQLGSGAFGEVWEIEEPTTKQRYAKKIPKPDKDIDRNRRILNDEATVYENIGKTLCALGIDPYKSGIPVTTMHNGELYMSLFGPSISSFAGKLSNTMIAKIAIRLISILKSVHTAGYIHRDIKPDNILLSRENPKKFDALMLVDFGIATEVTETCMPTKMFVGTLQFQSIAAHNKLSQSPKDDLESLVYTLVYLKNGKLPWGVNKNLPKDKKRQMVLNCKKKTTDEQLCKDMPREFLVLAKYVNNMSFNEEAPYDDFIKMFRSFLSRH